MQMFALPETPKEIGSWTVRRKGEGDDNVLKTIRYPEITVTGIYLYVLVLSSPKVG